MLYPQNGDRIVAIDTVTSLHPMYCNDSVLTGIRLNHSFRSLSFVSFKIHYMDFPHCLLLLLSISVFLLFSFFCFYTFLVVGSVR